MFAPRRYGSALSAERSQSFKCSVERGFIPFFIKCFRRRFYRQILYIEGVQSTPHGPEPAVQRVQSCCLYDFCTILIKCTAIPELPIGGRCLGLRAAGPLLLSFVLKGQRHQFYILTCVYRSVYVKMLQRNLHVN